MLEGGGRSTGILSCNGKTLEQYRVGYLKFWARWCIEVGIEPSKESFNVGNIRRFTNALIALKKCPNSKHTVLASVKGYFKCWHTLSGSLLPGDAKEVYLESFRLLLSLKPVSVTETGLRLEHLICISGWLGEEIKDPSVKTRRDFMLRTQIQRRIRRSTDPIFDMAFEKRGSPLLRPDTEN